MSYNSVCKTIFDVILIQTATCMIMEFKDFPGDKLFSQPNQEKILYPFIYLRNTKISS